ncbi:amidohydrolase family protein [Candidatus Pacearchaeota archaeon]|nr:amidohydrolase family protein [Candidatus Pacearchaeota archaeon]
MVKFIDAHVHLGSIPYNKVEWGSFAEYQSISKKLDIERYCVVPIGLPENFVDNSTPNNKMVLQELKRDDSIIPIYWFNVFDLPKSIDKRYKAVKFHPDIGEVSINDKRVVDFVGKMGLPLFAHTNESKDYSNLGLISELARKVSVPVIAVHSGSVTRTFFRLDNYRFPDNVYFETSGIQYAIILKKIYNMFGAERIVFGSDYPFGDPRVSLAMIDTLNLSNKEHELVMRNNISGILNIK